MSGLNVVHTFVSLEESEDALTIHFLNEAGQPGAFWFGNGDSDHEYRAVCVIHGGRDYTGAPDHVVSVMLLKRGEEGEIVVGFVKASHIFAVRLPQAKAWELSRKIGDLMNGERDEYTPKFEAAYLPSYFLQAA